MTKTQEKFQKAFLMQVRATLKGNTREAMKARELVNFYRRGLDR